MVCSAKQFTLGKIVATQAAYATLEENNISPQSLLHRHLNKDWGVLSQNDREQNDMAVENEGDMEQQGRVMSVYPLPSGEKVWIITEWDRSVTTILMPSDY